MVGQHFTKYPQFITVETPDGKAEAIKEEQGEYWTVNFPWFSDIFYGSIPEVKNFMKFRIKKWIVNLNPEELKELDLLKDCPLFWIMNTKEKIKIKNQSYYKGKEIF